MKRVKTNKVFNILHRALHLHIWQMHHIKSGKLYHLTSKLNNRPNIITNRNCLSVNYSLVPIEHRRMADATAPGKRRRGRQKTRMKDLCNRSMESLRLKVEDVMDRTKWKSEIHKQSGDPRWQEKPKKKNKIMKGKNHEYRWQFEAETICFMTFFYLLSLIYRYVLHVFFNFYHHHHHHHH